RRCDRPRPRLLSRRAVPAKRHAELLVDVRVSRGRPVRGPGHPDVRARRPPPTRAARPRAARVRVLPFHAASGRRLRVPAKPPLPRRDSPRALGGCADAARAHAPPARARGRGVKVWIDLSNSPHPLLFAPIARALEGRGHEVAVTVRDHAQTLELARERWPT